MRRHVRWSFGRNCALVFAVILAYSTACDSPTGPEADLRRPKQTADGWTTASLSSVAMDADRVGNLLELIDATENHLIHSLLIAKDGRLVFEHYWSGVDLRPEDLVPVQTEFDRNTLHYVASVSKSVTSALAGIALDRGVVGSVEHLVFDFFPEHEDLRVGEAASVTLEHVLSFTSGFHWNEFVYGFDDPRDSHNMMFASTDPIRHLLGRPMDSEPGELFNYNSGDTNLVGEIVRRESGTSTLMAFSEEALFDPLQIDDYGWTTIGADSGPAFASGGVSLRPRDMAKLGQLYLDGGVWNGRRVMSQDWVEESTEMAIPLVGEYSTLYGYGYNWWLGRFQFEGSPVEYFRAAGWGGQDVFAVPALDLVIVFTAGGFYQSRPLSVNRMIQDFIFPAIED
ncbi:MAG: beta-lactamase family protein [Gemmatimonadetes bacterium]|nr:beta-lactamase family protein [Gemmatimonadota bacterium]